MTLVALIVSMHVHSRIAPNGLWYHPPHPAMRDLIRFFSYRSFVIAASVVGVLLAFVLTRDGRSALDAIILAAYVAGCAALNLWLRTPKEKLTSFDELAAFDRVLREGRPTLLEFYSDQCAACLANRPLLDSLERQAGNRLQVLRVDVRSPIGARLADRYDVIFTPTFVLFNGRGEKQQEFVYVVNRGWVLYYLDQQSRK